MLDRKVAPPFVKTTSFDLIKPEEISLPNGIDFFFVTGGFQDVLKIELIFPAGKWFEEKCGSAYFTAHLLSKGTKQKNSFEIAEILDRYGAHLEVSPGLDFVSISLYTLNKNLAPVLDVLLEILTEPTFSEKEFDQAKIVFIQNLQVNNEKTSFICSKLFRKNLFGATHPYGSEIEETDVNTLQTTDLRNHYADFFRSIKIFVSGKIEPGDKEMIREAFTRWPKAAASPGLSRTILAQPSNDYVEKKESVQSSIRIGRRSILRAHPDYVPVVFVGHILGGYFGSRLMKNIREEKGLTYGISASIHALKRESYLVIGADVNKENVHLTFDEIRKELKILRTTKISSGELETTRNHFIGSLQSEITTPFAHADKIKTIKIFDLSEDHYQNMIARIENINASEIMEISEKFYDEESFYQVAVG
ncbi:MAG: pitrilysin family protein [Cyclobacteriaceae bacterium]